MNVSLTTDRLLIRAAARSTRYLHVSFTAPAAPPLAERRPLRVAFVVDRSGSMAGEKIRLASQAVDAAVGMLQPEDVFSVVVYDDRVDVVVPATHATTNAREMALDRLAAIGARGSTDLGAGWQCGCEQVADGVSRDTIARCLLLSDGRANRGMTNRAELSARAGELRATHVVTSTFGVGASFDERLMTSMAHAGGGNAYFIEHAEQIRDLLTSELGEALEVVARGALLHLDLPSGVDAEVVHDFRSTVTGRCLRIELDDLVSGQEVSCIVKLRFPEGVPGDRLDLHASVSSEDEAVAGEAGIAWTFADHEANDRQPRNRDVDRLVAAIYADRARRDAVQYNRAGDYVAAAEALDATARRIRRYAAGDPVLNRIIEALKSERRQADKAMEPLLMKQIHYDSASALKGRDSSGRAHRRRSAERLTVEEVDGHLFVLLPDGSRFLFATGSPVTLAERRTVTVLGRQCDAASQMGRVLLDAIRGMIAAPIDGLLGMDVAGSLFWTLDVMEGALTFSQDSLSPAGHRVPYTLVGGVPVIRTEADGCQADAFIETGAWLSYMPVADAARHDPVDSCDDFVLLPEPTRFRTDLYQRTIQLGGVEVTSEFGVLPPHVSLPVSVRNAWILGAQVLAQRPFSFDPRRRVISFGELRA